mgnify:CR=1 FL=1
MATYSNDEGAAAISSGIIRDGDYMIYETNGQYAQYDASTGRWRTVPGMFASQGDATTSGLQWTGDDFVNTATYNSIFGTQDTGASSPASGTDTANGDATTSIVGGGNNQGGNTMATDWSDWVRPDVFGEYTPEQQYTALMQQALPNYYTPRYSQMASRQFTPTFGRYLLGGYGGNATGAGTGMGFSDWFTSQPGGYSALAQPQASVPANISGGYNLARQFGAETPGSAAWDALAAQNATMASSMQDPEAVQAMALARYYGGGGPAGGYVGRAIQNTLGDLYGRYANTGALAGNTSPAGFLNYLGDLSGSRFGAMA